jgi:hypothetical protein
MSTTTSRIELAHSFIETQRRLDSGSHSGVWNGSRFQLYCEAIVYNINLNNFKNIFNLNNK